MSTRDKVNNKGEEVEGKVKERAGKASGDKSMQAKGRATRTKGSLKQAGEKVKDAL
jgi:uncharacterized protein YjbJ (UPF0337 family)